jgi:hypothetical protein
VAPSTHQISTSGCASDLQANAQSSRDESVKTDTQKALKALGDQSVEQQLVDEKKLKETEGHAELEQDLLFDSAAQSSDTLDTERMTLNAGVHEASEGTQQGDCDEMAALPLTLSSSSPVQGVTEISTAQLSADPAKLVSCADDPALASEIERLLCAPQVGFQQVSPVRQSRCGEYSAGALNRRAAF